MFRTASAAIAVIGIFSVFTFNTRAETSEFKLGVLVCVSGECAESGNNSLKGIQLAVDELNASGGILGRKVSFQLEDTAEGTASGAGAVTAFRKLLENPEIKYFIGPSWTPGGLSVAPIAAKRPDIIMTSPSLGVADFNRAGENLFNLWPHDEFASKYLAQFAIDRGWKRVAVFSSQQPWESLQGNTFDAEFKRLGGVVTSKQDPIPTAADLRAECLKIKQSQPDAVFLSNYTQMGVATKQLRIMGYKGPFFAILMDDSRIKTSEGALDGTIYAGYPEPDENFRKAYQERYKEKPGIGADTTYDVVKLYAWAIEKTGDFDPSKVIKTLSAAKYAGASGLIEFDEYGGVKKSPVLYQVKGLNTERYQR